jgi:hypothetical protein
LIYPYNIEKIIKEIALRNGTEPVGKWNLGGNVESPVSRRNHKSRYSILEPGGFTWNHQFHRKFANPDIRYWNLGALRGITSFTGNLQILKA